AEALCGPLSNRGLAVVSERNADQAVSAFRAAMADLLNADPRGIVYGRSATSLTYDFSRHLAKAWSAGDEIVLATLDHDCNIRPWVQAAARAGVTVRWWEFDPATTELSVADLAGLLTPRTRLVAVTAASNLLGTMPPIEQISATVHEVGALLYVDGVHYAAHAVVDLARLGADFFVCSPYKFMGPHCAALACAPGLLETLRPDKLAPSTDAVPERFELGTLPYEVMAGTTAAVDFIAGVAATGPAGRRERVVAGSSAFEVHELALRSAVETSLRGWDRVTVHSKAVRRTPTLFFTIDGIRSWDVYLELADADILVPAGSFYADEAFRRLTLSDPHGLRVGIAPYNDEHDVDRLLDALARIVAR
ncbi:MAG TPA: cysteine desulfurase-like protein, partial [Candidatus Lustribacter sp.]|nr:cysteine desulfurase-like protein [Candidatus Lustribacter sp.]